MKSIILLLSFLSLQAYSQNNLFRHNQDVYADFGYSKEELSEFRSQGTLSVFNKERHNSNLANELFELKQGGTLKLNNANNKKIKVLKKVNVEHFRINYIFFDGQEMSYEDLDHLRDQIIQMSKNQDFEHLAQRYSMDMNKNKGGDSGWFKKRSVPEDFKNAALSSIRAANETFKVDLEDKDWYYLVSKSYSPKNIEEILVLETQD
ncbi:peptidylprolyl isomerase [Psychroflexus montanilacus]|uniref:peptidylprolyl isomerase n=1 Tax=Psychroflexus montanilacus TaxID=2873598 RepID=UPI001CC96451|nr:peptidylprolyl isomerase [Psychroflexus montanilacus]MBZ9650397.1 peptidylprolyl isomerase [Psychroflexus montanilacus]